MQIISDVEEGKLTGTAIYQHIYDELVRWSATDELFEEKLKGETFTKRMLALQDSFSALLLRNT